MPDPTSGQVLTRDNAITPPIKWEDVGALIGLQTIFRPVGGTMIDVAAATVTGTGWGTTEVDGECRAWYIGRAPGSFASIKVGVDVLTAVVAPTWCELALLKGAPVLWAGPSALTLLGFADTSTDWSVPGPVPTTITATISPGDHLWIAHACLKSGGADPLPVFRAVLPDYIISGVSVYASATRPSTMAAGTNFNRCGAAVRGMDFLAGCS